MVDDRAGEVHLGKMGRTRLGDLDHGLQSTVPFRILRASGKKREVDPYGSLGRGSWGRAEACTQAGRGPDTTVT